MSSLCSWGLYHTGQASRTRSTSFEPCSSAHLSFDLVQIARFQLGWFSFCSTAKRIAFFHLEPVRTLYTNTRKLVAAGTDEEAPYIPLVREYISVCKEYEGPKEAASGMTKSLKRKSAAGESRSKKRKSE